MTAPAGAALAKPSKPSEPSAPSTPAQPRTKPHTGSAATARPRIDADTLHMVEAYEKYHRKVARQERRAKTATSFARKQIGKPYRWGASGPDAYDCSGLVMKAWQKAGVRLPRVTYSQYSAVRRKVGMKSLRPGDLVFFHGRGHVGMYVSKNRFIHAPNSGSRIRINKLSGYRKRTFAGAVRPGAPAKKTWPASIAKIARELDAQGTLARARQTAAHEGSATAPQGRHSADAPERQQSDPPSTPEPRPVTQTQPSDIVDDGPFTPHPLGEDVLPAGTLPKEEQAPPGS